MNKPIKGRLRPTHNKQINKEALRAPIIQDVMRAKRTKMSIDKLKLGREMVVVHITHEDDNSNRVISAPDSRCTKPLGFHDLEDGYTYFFQRIIKASIDGKDFSLAAPNEISMSLNISRNSLDDAIKLRSSLKNMRKPKSGILYKKNVKKAYNYLEKMQTAIIFSYKAVESFCNSSIPDDFVYKKINSKGIIEHYGKEQVERWVNTSEKLSKILPKFLKKSSPTRQEFWQHFKKLEKVRNEIVHSKSGSTTATLVNLFSSEIDKYVDSAFQILYYFVADDPGNEIFPLGFGESEIQMYEIDKIDRVFRSANSSHNK